MLSFEPTQLSVMDPFTSFSIEFPRRGALTNLTRGRHSRMKPMTHFQEKVLFSLGVLTSSASSMIGSILSDAEARWFYITLTASILMAAFLSLMFKKSDENIRLVIGRCGLAIFGGVFLTQPVIHWASLQMVYTDSIALAGISSSVCIFTFFVGFAFLKIVEAKAPAIAEKLFKKVS